MIETHSTHKSKVIKQNDELKESFPKSYMQRKLSHLMKKQEGQSDLEIYSGVSASFHSAVPKVETRFQSSKAYNLNELWLILAFKHL